jgi:hypothetical protein
VPYDVAFALEPEERLAYMVIMADIDGIGFDWNTRRFERRN